MGSCPFDRSLLQAHFDGEDGPDERNRTQAHLHTCQVCAENLSGAAWEVGLLLLNAPPVPGLALATPSTGFSERVRRAVRATPRAASSPVQAPPLRLLPPAPRAFPRVAWAGVAAAALVAAAGLLLLDRREPSSAPDAAPTPTGTGSVVAAGGGILRWTGRFDRGLEGSIWTGKDEAVPTLPGETLHSPEPSALQVRLPEGGRLEAGPLSWLAVGEGDEVALLDGALTAEAAAKPLVVEIPGVRISASGEVEVSVRTTTGASDSGAPLWLGAWAASRKPDATPGAAQPDTPGIVAVVYARKGAVETAGSPGPVRNSLEKSGPIRNSLERTRLDEGQALILIDGKSYLLKGVEESAPGDKGGWLQGLPAPPRSVFFRGRRGGAAPAVPPTASGSATGPVRNSLERMLGDPAAGVRDRVFALAVYEGTGGAAAVAAAARAATDAAVEVRSSAVRVLALHARADRPGALAALRLLAKDGDEGVARFAILALKTLRDAEAAPLLRGVVADSAAPVVARVYAFDALVAFGDASLVAEAAALAPEVEQDPQLSRALEFAITGAFAVPGATPARSYLTDARPAVRAAALRALKDREAFKAALADPSPVVQVAAAQSLLMRVEPVDFESLRPAFEAGKRGRDMLWTTAAFHLNLRRSIVVPAWMKELARADIEVGARTIPVSDAIVKVLAHAADEEFLAGLFDRGTPVLKEAVLRFGSPVAGRVLAGLKSDMPGLRAAAAARLVEVANLPADQAPSESILEALRSFVPSGATEARDAALALGALASGRGELEGVRLLVAMARSPRAFVRQGAAAGLARAGSHREAAAALESLLDDAAREVAESSSLVLMGAASRAGWAGRAAAGHFPSASPHAVVRARIALEAHRKGIPEAAAAFRREFDGAASGSRKRILDAAAQGSSFVPDLGPSVLDDPSPAVRLWALLLQEEAAATAAARSLAEDPALWVRATALALLARAGEASSLDALRGLVRIHASRGDEGDRLLRSLDPEHPELATRILTPARLLASAGSAGDSLASADRGLAHLLEALSNRGRAERLAATLREPPDPETLTAAIRGLGSCSVLEGYAALASESLPERLSTEHRDALADAFNMLAGFRPAGGPVAFGKSHPRGFVSPDEILSQAGK